MYANLLSGIHDTALALADERTALSPRQGAFVMLWVRGCFFSFLYVRDEGNSDYKVAWSLIFRDGVMSYCLNVSYFSGK